MSFSPNAGINLANSPIAALKIYEISLSQALDIPVIYEEALNPEFEKYILKEDGRDVQDGFSLNLTQALINLSGLISKLEASSLNSHIKEIKEILEKLLLNIKIFDPQIQQHLKPLREFLAFFKDRELLPSDESGRAIADILQDYEDLIAFSERREAQYQEILNDLFEAHRASIVKEANIKRSIQSYLEKILEQYIEKTVDSKVNRLYALKSLTLKLIDLQDSKCLSAGKFYVKNRSEINKGITHLLEKQKKLQNIAENIAENSTEPSFTSTFAFKVIAVTGVVAAGIGLTVLFGILTAGVGPTIAGVIGAGALIAAHSGTAAFLTMAGIGVLSGITHSIHQTFFGKNAVKNKQVPGGSEEHRAPNPISEFVANIAVGLHVLGRL